MGFDNSTVDGFITASITAPISSGSPATIRSLMSARALAAISGKAIVQIEVISVSVDIKLFDPGYSAGNPEDYVLLPVTVSSVSALDAFVISTGAASVARLIIHTHRSVNV